MMKFTLCAAVMAMSLPFVAQAAPIADNVASAKVGYADLDFSRSQDAAVMLQRLEGAALEVCGASPFSLPDYRSAVQRSECYRAGLDHAVAALNVPAVSELYHTEAGMTLASTAARRPAGG